MIAKELISYLCEEIKNLKKYSGDELTNHLEHIEQVISAGREEGYISDKKLKLLIRCGYLNSKKQGLDEILKTKGIEYLHQQSEPILGRSNCYVFKKGSEMEKLVDELGEAVSIMLGIRK
jgi:hypothetical protein